MLRSQIQKETENVAAGHVFYVKGSSIPDMQFFENKSCPNDRQHQRYINYGLPDINFAEISIRFIGLLKIERGKEGLNLKCQFPRRIYIVGGLFQTAVNTRSANSFRTGFVEIRRNERMLLSVRFFVF